MSEEISKSKQKRLAIKEARNKAQAKKTLNVFLAVAIPVLVLALAVGAILYLRQSTTKNTIDFSKSIASDGTIANISIDDYIDFDYKSMSFSKADLLPSDEVINADIEAMLAGHRYIPEDDTAVSKEGDQVNISYTSYIDGVQYNEITNESGGSDFTIGEAVISEEFDKALTGHKKGDTFKTSVTYAADYSVAELAGKTVDYEIEFNGIYIIPEFNDEFIAQFYSDKASSAEEYRVGMVNEYYETNLSQAIAESISANYVIKKMPEEYIANDELVLKQTAETQFSYYNQMYASYGLEPMTHVYEMYGLASDEELDEMIHETAIEETELLLAYQSVFVHEGLTNTPEEVRAYFLKMGYDDESYNEYMAQYGYNYLACAALQGKVLEYLVENVTITP